MLRNGVMMDAIAFCANLWNQPTYYTGENQVRECDLVVFGYCPMRAGNENSHSSRILRLTIRLPAGRTAGRAETRTANMCTLTANEPGFVEECRC